MIEAAARQWQEEGWAIVPALVPGDVCAEALAELRAAEPGPDDVASISRPRRDPSDDDGPAFRAAQFTGTLLFPVRSAPTLNRLFVDARLVALARAALGTDDVRLYQSRIWSKWGDLTNYEQPMHRDLNHSLLPTRSEPGFWHLEVFLYLHDVDADNGALRLVPRVHDPARDPAADQRAGRDEAPHLYDEEIRVDVPAGSVLAYRSDIWHRGADLSPGTERHVVVAGYKPAGIEWIDYDVHPPLSINRDFQAFVASCGPDELSLFGVPRPGHPYWTAPVVDEMHLLYPDLDLSPWRAALEVSPTA